MMKIDGRDNAECQNWENRDIMIILEFDLNDNKTKNGYSVLLQLKASDAVGWTGFGAAAKNGDFP